MGVLVRGGKRKSKNERKGSAYCVTGEQRNGRGIGGRSKKPGSGSRRPRKNG